MGGVVRHHLADEIRRYDPRLFLRYGLHPKQVRRIALGMDVPYAERRFCYTLYRKTKHGDIQVVFPYTVPGTDDPLPLDRRIMQRIYDADMRRWFKNDKINVHNWQRYQREHLGDKTPEEHDTEALAAWEDQFKQEGIHRLRHLMKKELRACY